MIELFNMKGDLEKTGDPEKEAARLVNFPKEFPAEFCQLVQLMDEKESKKLNATAKTNVFPRKTWLPEWINNLVLYLTSALYMLARVAILAVGFSSLRQMPASVYDNTPWTVYIHNIGGIRLAGKYGKYSCQGRTWFPNLIIQSIRRCTTYGFWLGLLRLVNVPPNM